MAEIRTLFIDFETYYDKDYSLSKMPTQAYVTDPRFRVLMASVALDDSDVVVLEPEHIAPFLATLDPDTTAVVSHNSIFDQLILSCHYGFVPVLSFDTLALARYLGWHVAAGGASLDALSRALAAYAPHLGLPVKGKAVEDAKGKTREDFTPAAWDAYKDYCKTDTVLLCALWHELVRYARETMTPEQVSGELTYEDIILKCATNPRLKIDGELVAEELADVLSRQEQTLEEVRELLGCDTTAEVLAQLRSNDRFAAVLQAFGAVPLFVHGQVAGGTDQSDANGNTATPQEPVLREDNDAPLIVIPQKVSKTTGKWTWAFGKTDQGMLDLLDCDDSRIEAIVEARLGSKSSIAETRARAFLRLSEDGFLSIPYIICGAHTSRMSGAGGVNLQNLPSGRVKGQKNTLRRSIIPRDPENVIVVVDSSQVEVRASAFISNNFSVNASFAEGKDIYVTAAAGLYGEDYEHIRVKAKIEEVPEYKMKRQVAKAAVLSCQFGTGAKAFRNYAKVVGGVTLSEAEAKEVVDTWRKTNHETVGMWRRIEYVLADMAAGNQGWFGGADDNLFFYDGSRHVLGVHVPGIRLPSGVWINYKGLAAEQGAWDDGSPKTNWYFYQHKGGKMLKTYTYSSKVYENLTQGLAFQVMAWQAVQIAKRYPIAMNSHDEWVIVVHKDEAEAALSYMIECMKTPPPWTPGLLLGAEGSIAPSYGDAK